MEQDSKKNSTILSRKVLTSHKTDIWNTPDWLFKLLDDKFHFTLDPATDGTNNKCPLFFTEKQNGLIQDWTGHVVWCNPPYSQNKQWTEKMATCNATTVVGLIPARTGAKYFHSNVFAQASQILFFNYRIKFEGGISTAPFDSVLILWGKGSFEFLVPQHGQLFIMR